MKKVMFIAFSILLTTGATVSAQEVVKVVKDSTTTTVTTSTKVEPFKTEMKIPTDSTKTTVTTTTKVEPVRTEMKAIDLPQPVKDLGASFKTQGWDTLEKAYVVKGVTGDVIFYVVTFKNPTTGESKSINIDANGNIVKE